MFPIAFHSIFKHPLPEGHRFPMLKYELLPQQLLHEGIALKTDFFEPEIIPIETVLRIHTKEYVSDLLNLTLDPKAARKIGFPLSKELVERELEAFCLLNDQAIAAQYLLDKKLAKKILIIDLDVHQGNGTAEIFQNNDNVFTFSTHGKSNYPFKKETSDLDIAFEDNTSDEDFLKTISEIIPKLIEQQKPDFIFYLAGVDILASDKLGKLGCSIDGCKKRDEIVFQNCEHYQIPVQVSMGGGYSPEIKTIIEAHANTYRVAKDILF